MMRRGDVLTISGLLACFGVACASAIPRVSKEIVGETREIANMMGASMWKRGHTRW